jgi:hypothetical protein
MSAAQDSFAVTSTGTGTVTFASMVTATSDPLPKGGVYTAVVTSGTWGGGSVALQTLAADGSTWVQVASYSSPNSVGTVTLSRRQYRIVVTTALAVSAEFQRVSSAE